MKRVLLFVVFILIALPAFAEEKAAEKVRPDSEVTDEKKEPRTEQKTKKKSQAAWPRAYSPTEEVRADSIVPFPTDI